MKAFGSLLKTFAGVKKDKSNLNYLTELQMENLIFCMDYIENQPFDQGIYRVSGDHTEVHELEQRLIHASVKLTVTDPYIEQVSSVHSVSGAIKRVFMSHSPIVRCSSYERAAGMGSHSSSSPARRTLDLEQISAGLSPKELRFLVAVGCHLESIVHTMIMNNAANAGNPNIHHVMNGNASLFNNFSVCIGSIIFRPHDSTTSDYDHNQATTEIKQRVENFSQFLQSIGSLYPVEYGQMQTERESKGLYSNHYGGGPRTSDNSPANSYGDRHSYSHGSHSDVHQSGVTGGTLTRVDSNSVSAAVNNHRPSYLSSTNTHSNTHTHSNPQPHTLDAGSSSISIDAGGSRISNNTDSTLEIPIVDRSLKLVFPTPIDYTPPQEQHIHSVFEQYGKITQVGIKAKFAVIVFSSPYEAIICHDAVYDTEEGCIDIAGVSGFRLKYIGDMTVYYDVMQNDPGHVAVTEDNSTSPFSTAKQNHTQYQNDRGSSNSGSHTGSGVLDGSQSSTSIASHGSNGPPQVSRDSLFNDVSAIHAPVQSNTSMQNATNISHQDSFHNMTNLSMTQTPLKPVKPQTATKPTVVTVSNTGVRNGATAGGYAQDSSLVVEELSDGGYNDNDINTGKNGWNSAAVKKTTQFNVQSNQTNTNTNNTNGRGGIAQNNQQGHVTGHHDEEHDMYDGEDDDMYQDADGYNEDGLETSTALSVMSLGDSAGVDGGLDGGPVVYDLNMQQSNKPTRGSQSQGNRHTNTRDDDQEQSYSSTKDRNDGVFQPPSNLKVPGSHKKPVINVTVPSVQVHTTGTAGSNAAGDEQEMDDSQSSSMSFLDHSKFQTKPNTQTFYDKHVNSPKRHHADSLDLIDSHSAATSVGVHSSNSSAGQGGTTGGGGSASKSSGHSASKTNSQGNNWVTATSKKSSDPYATISAVTAATMTSDTVITPRMNPISTAVGSAVQSRPTLKHSNSTGTPVNRSRIGEGAFDSDNEQDEEDDDARTTSTSSNDGDDHHHHHPHHVHMQNKPTHSAGKGKSHPPPLPLADMQMSMTDTNSYSNALNQTSQYSNELPNTSIYVDPDNGNDDMDGQYHHQQQYDYETKSKGQFAQSLPLPLTTNQGLNSTASTAVQRKAQEVAQKLHHSPARKPNPSSNKVDFAQTLPAPITTTRQELDRSNYRSFPPVPELHSPNRSGMRDINGLHGAGAQGYQTIQHELDHYQEEIHRLQYYYQLSETNYNQELIRLQCKLHDAEQVNIQLAKENRDVKVTLSGKIAECLSIQKSKEVVDAQVEGIHDKAKRDAYSTVLSQTRLISVLDSQRVTLEQQCSQTNERYELLKIDFAKLSDECLEWKTTALATQQLLNDQLASTNSLHKPLKQSHNNSHVGNTSNDHGVDGNSENHGVEDVEDVHNTSNMNKSATTASSIPHIVTANHETVALRYSVQESVERYLQHHGGAGYSAANRYGSFPPAPLNVSIDHPIQHAKDIYQAISSNANSNSSFVAPSASAILQAANINGQSIKTPITASNTQHTSIYQNTNSSGTIPRNNSKHVHTNSSGIQNNSNIGTESVGLSLNTQLLLTKLEQSRKDLSQIQKRQQQQQSYQFGTSMNSNSSGHSGNHSHHQQNSSSRFQPTDRLNSHGKFHIQSSPSPLSSGTAINKSSVPSPQHAGTSLNNENMAMNAQTNGKANPTVTHNNTSTTTATPASHNNSDPNTSMSYYSEFLSMNPTPVAQQQYSPHVTSKLNQINTTTNNSNNNNSGQYRTIQMAQWYQDNVE